MCPFKLGVGVLLFCFFFMSLWRVCMLSAKKINRTNSMAPQVGQLLAFAYSNHGLSLQGHVLIYNRSGFQSFLNWFFRHTLQSYKVSWKVSDQRQALQKKWATSHTSWEIKAGNIWKLFLFCSSPRLAFDMHPPASLKSGQTVCNGLKLWFEHFSDLKEVINVMGQVYNPLLQATGADHSSDCPCEAAIAN